MRLYLDSNVLISFVRSEIDSAFNLRFKQTEDFFSKCRVYGIELAISDFFLFEIRKIVFLDKKSVQELFDSLGVPIVLVKEAPKEKACAVFRKTGLHFSDSLHVATAIEAKCEAIISWNKKDFEKAKELIPFFTPIEFFQDNP